MAWRCTPPGDDSAAGAHQRQPALDRAERSTFLRETLGAGFLDCYLAIKRQECEKFGALVSYRDYEWFLDTV